MHIPPERVVSHRDGMPSPHLSRAQAIVRHHCQELGVSYLETGLIASYTQALRSLHHAGAPLRRTPKTA